MKSFKSASERSTKVAEVFREQRMKKSKAKVNSQEMMVKTIKTVYGCMTCKRMFTSKNDLADHECSECHK